MSRQESSSISTAKESAYKSTGVGLGFLILAVLITFVAYWMSVQGRDQSISKNSPSTDNSNFLNGFRKDIWQLPDEPLLGFVMIPAGSFMMGSNPVLDSLAYVNEQWSAAQRQGRIDLPAFFMARLEVTVAQYQAFIAATAHPAVEASLLPPPNHPVSNITWTDALAYCRWLDASIRKSDIVPREIRDLLEQGWRITLPTEAQWEKAARGGDGRIFPWGNEPMVDRANYGNEATRPVGSYACPECSFGLSDMSGNVWELTRSPYQSYPYNEDDDRAGLDQDALWVMRGGAYADSLGNIRAAVRGGVDPGVRSEIIGFRLVLSK